MAFKATRSPLGVEAISEFLAKSSDFSFEMKTKQILSRVDDQTSFSGSYIDPVSGKQWNFPDFVECFLRLPA